MEKGKGFFGKPKRAAAAGICLVGFLAILGAGAVLARPAIVKETSIGEENAKNFAFADLGIDPLSAENVHVEFGYEQGQFVYKVEFLAEGSEYEYWMKAADGAVVKKEVDLVAGRTGQSDSMPKDLAQSQKGSDESQPDAADSASQSQPSQGKDQTSLEDAKDLAMADQSQPSQGKGQISLEDAKGVALADAGLSSEEVVFTKTELDQDDHITVYEIDFYTSEWEYEYEVDASAGEIRSKDKEAIENGHDGISGTSGAASPNTGVEQAKSIAASHAGFSVSEVAFTKVKLEEEHGEAVYEIKFYKDRVEYEYEISAASGEILKFESAQDD